MEIIQPHKDLEQEKSRLREQEVWHGEQMSAEAMGPKWAKCAQEKEWVGRVWLGNCERGWT